MKGFIRKLSPTRKKAEEPTTRSSAVAQPNEEDAAVATLHLASPQDVFVDVVIKAKVGEVPQVVSCSKNMDDYVVWSENENENLVNKKPTTKPMPSLPRARNTPVGSFWYHAWGMPLWRLGPSLSQLWWASQSSTLKMRVPTVDAAAGGPLLKRFLDGFAPTTWQKDKEKTVKEFVSQAGAEVDRLLKESGRSTEHDDHTGCVAGDDHKAAIWVSPRGARLCKTILCH